MFANKFWVGGSGDWNASVFGASPNFSNTSGGAPGAVAPSATDDVIFDANSFSVDGQIVQVVPGSACRNMTVSGTTHTFVLNNNATTLGIHGSYQNLDSGNMAVLPGHNSGSGSIQFAGTGTIDDTGGGLGAARVIIASTGLYSLTTQFSADGFYIESGSFDANDQDIQSGDILLYASATSILMGSGTWTVDGSRGIHHSLAVGVSDAAANITAETSTVQAVNGGNLGLGMRSQTYHNITIDGTSTIGGNYPYVTAITVPPTYTIATLLLEPGSDLSLVAQTSYVIGTLDAQGLSSSQIGLTGLGGPISVSAGTTLLNYDIITNITASGGGSWNALHGVDSGGNTGISFAPLGTLPDYNTSLISAVARIQQGLAFPSFIIGGAGGITGTDYALFKRTDEYTFSLFRSEVFHVGKHFSVTSITIPLARPMDNGMALVPVLRFDHEQKVSVGTVINATSYPNGEQLITLTPEQFPDGVQGDSHFFLELQHVGSTLCAVSLPILINAHVDDE